MVWSQLELTDPHIAYACVGVFSTLFSLVSLFVKERLFIGEATVATIAGLIFGPHCLNWFDPLSWGDSEIITLEISRIVLCVQIVAVAVELPRKYMKKHWLSVAIFLLPVMTIGWLVVGLFIWLLIPHFRFGEALLVSACVTATDPVLAAAVVGKGKFAERVPGHLRNLLSAESGCNDGMAFPFIFLSLNLLIHPGNAGEIVKDWIVITILYQCIFGIVLGSIIGYVLRKLVALAEKRNIIDRESFLAFFIFLAFNSAGFGSILGVDDLLVAFAAGTAFGWNGDFAKKTEESHVSTVIDLIINLAFFVYFGAIIPWADFNNSLFGLDIWRLVVLALVIIFLRRLPAVVALKPFTPDLKSWREAFFCGHFGPIGVGAIFAVILARRDLEEHFHVHLTGLDDDAIQNEPHYRLLNALWPIVNFVVITSIVVHGSSVAVLTLGKRLNRMAITMTFTSQNDQTGNWLSRLHNLERTTTSFSLHRVDSDAVTLKDSETGVGLDRHDTVETSGIKYRPAGGAKRKSTKNKRKKRKGSRHNLIKTISRSRTHEEYDNEEESRPRPPSQFLQLGNTLPLSKTNTDNIPVDKEEDVNTTQPDTTTATESPSSSQNKPQEETPSRVNEGATAYEEGRKIIIEDASGEVIETLPIKEPKKPESPKTTKPKRPHNHIHNQEDIDNLSLHSMTSLNRHLTQYSSASTDSNRLDTPQEKNETASIAGSRKAYYKKNDPTQRKVFAHQIDDLILIENEDGEIIRRYKVNRHASTRRPRSDSVVNKALSFVGIKRNTKSQEQAGDLEKNSPILTPEYDAGVPELNNKRIEQKLENHLNNALVQTNKTTTQLPIPTIREHHIDEHLDEEDEDEDQDEDDEDYDDEYDSDMSENSNVSLDSDIQDETAVERSRRLAALGHTTIQRDEEDEED